MNNLKILHVLGYSIPNLSGYTIRSKYLIESEKGHGLQPTVITSPKYDHEKPFVSEVSYDGIQYHRTQDIKATFKIPFLREALLIKKFNNEISSIVQKEKIDVIHAHSPSLNGLSSLNISRNGRKIPVIYHVRALWEDAAIESGKMTKNSIKYRASSLVENFLFRKADHIVTICQGLKKEIVSRGYDENKIQIIENGVDTNTFTPRPPCPELLEQYKLENSCVVGFIGSFFKFEGVDTLIEAFRLALKSNPVLKLMLVGTGEEFDKINALRASYGLENSILITGRVPHEKILDYYSVMDILVYPRISKRITEMVTPLKPLEAMAMGKCVVGSNVGGIKELIADQVTGVLYRAGDDQHLAQTIIRLAEDPQFRAKLGEQAREAMCNTRTWSSIAGKMIPLYTELSKRYKSE